MKDFVAIDFETANGQPSSVCSVGVVIVRYGRVADTFYSLICPEPNYYSFFCQRVHGLCAADTDDAPVFPEVWAEVERRVFRAFFSDTLPFSDLFSNAFQQGISTSQPSSNNLEMSFAVSSVPFVAHNSRFDEGCLRAVFKVYQMDWPDYKFHDTLRASRRHFGRMLPNHQLHTVAAACGYDLTRHHHALADAEACAAIALRIL